MKPDIIADRYQIENKVGEGSYSIVFRGFDREEKRKVAIKEMKYDELPEEEAQDAQRIFFNEINVLKTLNHENLPKVYDFFIFEGRHYMVMEWCGGQNLGDILERSVKPLSEKDALSYMRQVCDALIYLQHKTRQVVYKDLKPSNIIVNKQGKIKLIDFGTARFYKPEKKKDTMILGTPGYAPPEAYTGIQTDLSADVYSFGATFYHLLTGEEPFQFKFNFPDPRTYNGELSEDISKLLLDCLKNRGERIKDAFQLRKRVYGINVLYWGEIEGSTKGGLSGNSWADKVFQIQGHPLFLVGFITLILFYTSFFVLRIYLGANNCSGILIKLFIASIFGVLGSFVYSTDAHKNEASGHNTSKFSEKSSLIVAAVFYVILLFTFLIMTFL